MAPIKGIEKLGIVAILDSDIKPVASLRRTLSADMSSKKWLSQNGLFSMKKIASSEGLVINGADSSSSSEIEEEYDENMPGQDEIWRSIQLQKEKQNNQTDQNPSRLDSWGSILSQKNYQDSSKESPPPYVHPLVKRSASSLSQKSLEICTENLGSETGSEEFSSGPGPDPPQTENYCQEKVSKSFGDINGVKYKTVSPRPLPPPISSIGGGDGNSLRMHCHRQNGRLILEAVSVPSENCFRASRNEGRLLLTLINPPTFLAAATVEEVASPAPADVEVEVQSVIEQNPNPAGWILSVDKAGLMVNNFNGLRNKMSPTWANKFNKTVKLMEVGEELPLPPLLPPRVARLISPPPPPPHPLPAVVASYNAYEYFWRNKTSFITTSQCIPLKNKKKISHSSGEKTYEHQDLVLISPSLKGCKEQRKSLLIWEPYCIATS
ncbi:protein FAF-like, chloroplastic [Olea europaea var. sylvestris]|uniref:protein FAF-like, chloroplastic n=1 Tax=Olea europaea var. sylvestris TaxID=158386 RepID=UPI000C1D8A10|nr:protein FAF-like, chloroplastic [Olea europaea var. sylvestris]